MGYRSEVAYILRFKNAEQKQTFINLQRAKADPHINEALSELVEVEDWGLGYHADHVKWYDGYEDVKAHETLMKDTIEIFANDETIPDYQDQAGYRFVRLGEEAQDNIDEEAGNSEELYEYVDWTRQINTSFQRNTFDKPEGEEA
jgi:hypothetical protein